MDARCHGSYCDIPPSHTTDAPIGQNDAASHTVDGNPALSQLVLIIWLSRCPSGTHGVFCGCRVLGRHLGVYKVIFVRRTAATAAPMASPVYLARPLATIGSSSPSGPTFYTKSAIQILVTLGAHALRHLVASVMLSRPPRSSISQGFPWTPRTVAKRKDCLASRLFFTPHLFIFRNLVAHVCSSHSPPKFRPIGRQCVVLCASPPT